MGPGYGGRMRADLGIHSIPQEPREAPKLNHHEAYNIILDANFPAQSRGRIRDFGWGGVGASVGTAAVLLICYQKMTSIPDITVENVDSVQNEKVLWCSAAIGAAFVLGKYITPKKAGQFLFRGRDVIDGMLDVGLGSVVTGVIASGGVMFYNNYGANGSREVGLISTALMVLGAGVMYKFYATGPVGKAKDTVANAIRKILRSTKFLAPPKTRFT